MVIGLKESMTDEFSFMFYNMVIKPKQLNNSQLKKSSFFDHFKRRSEIT